MLFKQGGGCCVGSAVKWGMPRGGGFSGVSASDRLLVGPTLEPEVIQQTGHLMHQNCRVSWPPVGGDLTGSASHTNFSVHGHTHKDKRARSSQSAGRLQGTQVPVLLRQSGDHKRQFVRVLGQQIHRPHHRQRLRSWGHSATRKGEEQLSHTRHELAIAE